MSELVRLLAVMFGNALVLIVSLNTLQWLTLSPPDHPRLTSTARVSKLIDMLPDLHT